ncbi:MAG: ATP-binding protein [Candidatus Dojkabacteria bacterium]|nr:ATP-binding protein [Candidatus Dojkabacteria bacterium]
MTDTIGYLNIFSSIFQIGLGFFVYLSDKRDKTKQYYFLSALFLGLWSLSIFFYSNPAWFSADIWLKIVYTMAYCMTLGLILFATVYPSNSKKKFLWFFFINLVYMITYSALMWTSDKVVSDVYHTANNYNSIALMGGLYWLYWLPLFVTAIYVVTHYVKQAKIFQGIEKRQVQFYVVGGIIMLFPVFLFDFVLPIFWGNTSFYKYSTIGNAVWTLIVGYSVLTTRFLDVRIFLGSIIITVLKSFALIIYTLAVVYFFIPFWSIDLAVGGIAKLLLLAIFGTFILNRAFKYLEENLLSKFVYVKYHPINSLTYYSSLNARSVSTEEVIQNLTKIIKDSFNPDFSSILLFNKDGELVHQNVSKDNKIEIEGLAAASKIWRQLNSNRILVLSELEKTRLSGKRMIDENIKQIIGFMNNNNIEIMLSIAEEDKFDSIIMIGKKPDRSLYTVNDIEFLDGIIQNTHMALIRSYLYSELEILNSSLQQKVSEQTQELQNKVKLLEEARRKEADMIDIMGHELRTPMSIVKLNTDLLHNFTHNVERRQEDFKKYVKRIKDAVDTEIKLINTLLSSAKLEGDKIELNPEKVDIIDQIKMALHAQESRAKKKGVEIFSKLDTNNRYVFSDHARTVEILNNLIDNAVKYTQKGGVTVTTEDEEEYVKISVIDTGEGMSQEDVENLGSKFFRTSNYTKSEYSDDIDIVRPGGTGLGLYVTFNLIRKMGGEIDVKSKLGEGSIFSFTLPKYVGQKSTPVADSKDMFSRLGLRE